MIDPEDKLGEEETAQRRDAAIRRALSTPPQPMQRPVTKKKERPASKGRVHKGRTRT